MAPSRRAFLSTLSSTIAATSAARASASRPDSSSQAPAAPRASRSSSFDPWVEVKADHLRHNVAEVSRLVQGRPITAVIKNNGYGAGVVEAARVVEPLAGVAGLAVIKLHEAIALRDAGVRKPVLLMGPFDEADLVEAVGRDVTPMVYATSAEALDRLVRSRRRPVRVQVCVDTGIGRVGIHHEKALEYIHQLAAVRGVEIAGIMMTFSEDPGLDREQVGRFTRLGERLHADGVPVGPMHAASSFSLFQRPDGFFDMVRPGMALFGVYSEASFRAAGVLDLRCALAFRTRVIYTKRLAAGESAGYERAFVAKEPAWVATLPVGHADGWPRTTAGAASVRIGGRLYPVVAVSASHTVVLVGAEPRVQIGDEATLFDWQDGSRPEDVNAACRASVYDLTMHLNPLLPRRMV